MYTMDHETDGNVLVIRTSGSVTTGEQAVEKARAIIDIGLDTGVFRVLLDERDLEMTVEVLEIVGIAKEFEERDLLLYGARVACLPKPECRDVYRVYETAYKNRSFSYQLFDDPARAMAWLME